MNKPFLYGRDGWNRRLLSFVKEQSGLPFHHIQRLKQGVWLLSTKKQQWILKEFFTAAKFNMQALFTKELRAHGFMQTYEIYPKAFNVDNRVFALIQYIEPNSPRTFQYNQTQNIVDAIKLLVDFHQLTEELVPIFQNKISPFYQLNKWEKRLENFEQSLKLHTINPIVSHLKNFSYYGNWAMKKMKEENDFFTREPLCIIHGDVASHNFIRGIDQKLYLIDFDLIGIAPPHIDYLQMANRILPFLNWSDRKLFSFSTFKNFENSHPFLSALVYPADIFREWLHFVKESPLEQKRKWPQIERMILNQYKQRISFYERISERIATL